MRRVLKAIAWLGFVAVGLFTVPSYATEDAEEGFPMPPKEWPSPVQDHLFTFIRFDRFEYQWGEDERRRMWEVQGWHGSDYNKLWVKAQGRDETGDGTGQSEFQILYARLISPFWYLQTGLRYDARPAPSRTFAAIGLQGLARYWSDIEATAFVSDNGDVSARVELEYELSITQRLLLQPQLETDIAFYRDEAKGIGRGVNDITLAFRLRYEIQREIAPYVGVTWSRSVGETADLAQRSGADIDEMAIVAGLRWWF